MGDKKLYKSTKNKILGGVCGGIAEYFGIDPIIIRILFVILPGGLLVYIILLLALQNDPGTAQPVAQQPVQPQ